MAVRGGVGCGPPASSFFDALLAWRRASADAGDGYGDRQQSADMRRACMERITTGISGHTGGTTLLSAD